MLLKKRPAPCLLCAVLLLAGTFGTTAQETTGEETPAVETTPETLPSYTVKRASEAPALSGLWDGEVWSAADTLEVSNFFPVGTHRPVTEARALYTEQGIYLHYRVQDQYVLTTRTEYRGQVWKDACVEFFVQPRPERGYFNFEINSGGTLLLAYHENPDYEGEGPRGGVPWSLAKQVQIYHSLPKIMAPETKEPVTWQIEAFIPFSLFEEYLGPLGDISGQEWRANFYKCAEDNSHPHWAAWSPILEGQTFHAPRFFGVLRFE